MSEDLRRFSHSLVQTFLQCPNKAFLQYVEKIRTPLGVPLLKGQATDSAWNDALTYKMETGLDIGEKDLLERTEQAYKDALESIGGASEVAWNGDTEIDVRDSTLRLSKTWRNELLPQIEPKAVQVELHRELPSGRDFVGFLDWVGDFDGTPSVGDNKTGKRRQSQDEADRNLQPTAYAWLAASPIRFVFARAIATDKSSYAEAPVTERGWSDVTWYDEMIRQVEIAWSCSWFPPNPTSTFCGKTCPFYAGACPVGRKD